MASVARLDIKLDPEIKAKAEKASALLGHKSLTDYVVNLMDKNASEVIAQYSNTVLQDDIFDKFMKACNKVEQPNKALVDALSFAQEQGFK